MNSATQLPFTVSIAARADIAKYAAAQITHILSIDNPGDTTTTPVWFAGKHWHVYFQDVESADEARQYSATLATRSDVEQILACAETCLIESRRRSVHLLIHCMAGASRSTAAGFAILCRLMGSRSESDAFAYVMRIKPDAFPNKMVVQIADDVLKREGRMIAALRPLREEANRAVDDWTKAMTDRRQKKTEQEAGPYGSPAAGSPSGQP